MRIISLSIDGYKIFNPSPKIKLGKDINLLIGVNGSGKSTILEAIAIIFSQVKEFCENPKRRERKFNFSIEYSFNHTDILEATTTTQNSTTAIKHVFLSTSKETGLDYTMVVDKEEILSPQEMYKYLPDNLIFYYAGACDTLEEIIDKTEDEQAKDLYNRTNEKNISRVIESITKNIIYIRKDYYPLLFALNYIDREQFLPLNDKGFSIKNIRFFIKQYRYTKNTDYKKLYNLTGFLRSYIDNLLKHSYGVQYDEDNNIAYFDVDYHRGIFDAIEDLPNLSEDQRFNQSRFLAFHFISLLFRIGLIKKISVAITDKYDKSYSIDAFSEGEQQLIILDAIKKVLCRNNSVLFLDEPDAYLHPQRQRELIPYLKGIYTESYTQIISTSHSPFVAQSVDIENILIFSKKGKIIPNPDELLDSYSTITDELFDVKTEFNLEVEDALQKFRNLRTKVFNSKPYNKIELNDIIEFLQSKGDEVKAIINREVNQLLKFKTDLLKDG